MKFVLSPHPHFRSPESTPRIMMTVIACLVPAGFWSLYAFGWRAGAVIAVSVLSSMAFEWLSRRFVFRNGPRLGDGSAALTGLLLAYCLPPGIPLWQVAIGAFFAVFVAKECFGGLGQNIFNPALIGRAALLSSFPVAMTSWQYDGVTQATPLAILRGATGDAPPLIDLFLGRVPGSIGEVSAILLLIGGLVLLVRRVISWQIPVVFIATVAVLSPLFGREALREILAGGVFLGAFFMATDYVSSPIHPRGRLVFGAGCGILTVLIRNLGAYPEGVCYSILLMNILVPLIDRYTAPRVFGTASAKAGNA
jgi:electron transport complex protein RnfD